MVDGDAMTASTTRRYARLVRDASITLLSIVNDVLDVSKIEAGSFELDPHAFAPRDLVEGAAALLRRTAEEKGLDLEAIVDPSVPASVIGGRGAAAAGPAQSPVQRGEVHREGHGAAHRPARQRVGQPRRTALRGDGYRNRHSRRAPPPPVPALQPDRQFDGAPVRRHGARPVDLQEPRRTHGRHDRGGEQRGPGLDLLVHARTARRRDGCVGGRSGAVRANGSAFDPRAHPPGRGRGDESGTGGGPADPVGPHRRCGGRRRRRGRCRDALALRSRADGSPDAGDGRTGSDAGASDGSAGASRRFRSSR